MQKLETQGFLSYPAQGERPVLSFALRSSKEIILLSGAYINARVPIKLSTTTAVSPEIFNSDAEEKIHLIL